MMVTDGDSEVETKRLETSPDTADEEGSGVLAHSTSAMFSGDAFFKFCTSRQLADLEKISAAQTIPMADMQDVGGKVVADMGALGVRGPKRPKTTAVLRI
jgi:hypothetical protein